jgi:hypothetical protein
VLLVPLDSVLLDHGEHLAHRVDEGEQRVRTGLVEGEVAVAQPAEQVLTRVRELAQPIEAQEPCGSLDGVDRAEDARQHLRRAGIPLELDELVVEPVEVLIALQEELLDDLIDLVRIH